MARNRKVEDQLLLARGEFAALLEARFEQWGLTIAEQDVAMMGIKGFSIAEVAEMRGTSEGTIKAQNASIYRKAGVTGRNPLLVSLVEDLIDVGVEEKSEIE
jgi:DNA-binding CsgD family transcriptional regulator